jgi:hypothetical protein
VLADCQHNFQSVHQQIFLQEKKFGGLVEKIKQGLAKVGGNTQELQRVLQELQRKSSQAVQSSREPEPKNFSVLQMLHDMWGPRHVDQQPPRQFDLRHGQPGLQPWQEPVQQHGQQVGQPALQAGQAVLQPPHQVGQLALQPGQQTGQQLPRAGLQVGQPMLSAGQQQALGQPFSSSMASPAHGAIPTVDSAGPTTVSAASLEFLSSKKDGEKMENKTAAPSDNSSLSVIEGGFVLEDTQDTVVVPSVSLCVPPMQLQPPVTR